MRPSSQIKFKYIYRNLQEPEKFLVAENVIGNRPDAVLFQMSASAKKKRKHLQTGERKKK